MNDQFQTRLLRAIPGGAHTYSRGYDQYPENAPSILSRGQGGYVYDDKGREFLDYGMALRAVNIGYAEPEISAAAIAQIQLGNNLTRASFVELEAAELIVDLIESVDMVKFTKNGSTAVSAAVKLARAFTGRDLIARCSEHPFFSYDDWFIGSTAIPKGVPQVIVDQTKVFRYNDIKSLENLVDEYPNQIACVVLEPSTVEHPAPSQTHPGETFLHDLQRLCEKHNIVFILDEMITGFRWDLLGAQHYYKIRPDLCTFGKAMANGFSVAAIGGKREIMELGSIDKKGAERVFLLSTTHGAEMSGLGAFIATVKFMQREPVISHFWSYGRELKDIINGIALRLGISDYFKVGGIDCSPYYTTFDKAGVISLPMRTLFAQEMIKAGVMIPWIALCYRHGKKELEKTASAVEMALETYQRALEDGWERYLHGDVIKPVFRKLN